MNTKIDVIELNNEELEIIKTLASSIISSPSEEPEKFCKESKLLTNKLPKRIKQILNDFVLHGSNTGYLLIKNIDVDIDIKNNELITPPTNNCKVGENTLLAKIQSILINVIGEMIAYEAEGYGLLFQDIVPVKHMENVQTSFGSNIELEIHTEQAFSKLRPEIFSLACIRGDPNAFTYFLPVSTILKNLDEKEIDLLRMPLWKTGVDLSFKLNGNEFIEGDIRGPIAIINGSEKDPFLIFDQDLMFGITPESNEMIKKIIDIYYNHRISHNLKPGEIVLIDNRRSLHGRSAFFPKYDGYDRFLIRCFLTMDYEATRYARYQDCRIVSAIYS
jgi:L-asparagine oxygenase